MFKKFQEAVFSQSFSSAPIGLVAGQGQFPVLFAQAARALNKKIVVFGLKGYTDKKVEDFAEETHYVELGALSHLVEVLKKSRVKNVVLAGSVPKKEIYNPAFDLDNTARGFINGTANKGDDHLLKAFKVFLKLKCGVSVIDSRRFLKDTLSSKGVMTRREPTVDEWKDLRFGYRVAKSIGKVDIGQTVVVKHGIVLAVEAIEGTDNTIRRAASLAHGETVVVKVSKPNQDLSFDLPCVGPDTLETMKSTSSKVLGVEAGKAIMIQKKAMIETANAVGITLVGL